MICCVNWPVRLVAFAVFVVCLGSPSSSGARMSLINCFTFLLMPCIQDRRYPTVPHKTKVQCTNVLHAVHCMLQILLLAPKDIPILSANWHGLLADGQLFQAAQEYWPCDILSVQVLMGLAHGTGGPGGAVLCYSYSCSRSSFASVSIDGLLLTTRSDVNLDFYGNTHLNFLATPVDRVGGCTCRSISSGATQQCRWLHSRLLKTVARMSAQQHVQTWAAGELLDARMSLRTGTISMTEEQGGGVDMTWLTTHPHEAASVHLLVILPLRPAIECEAAVHGR